MQVLESAIERRVVNWARKRGWRVKKLNGVADRGWPDRLFVGPGFTAFIEFKRPGATPTPLQGSAIEELIELSQNVEWFSDADEAIQWLLRLEAESVPAARGQVALRARRRRVVS